MKRVHNHGGIRKYIFKEITSYIFNDLMMLKLLMLMMINKKIKYKI